MICVFRRESKSTSPAKRGLGSESGTDRYSQPRVQVSFPMAKMPNFKDDIIISLINPTESNPSIHKIFICHEVVIVETRTEKARGKNTIE